MFNNEKMDIFDNDFLDFDEEEHLDSLLDFEIESDKRSEKNKDFLHIAIDTEFTDQRALSLQVKVSGFVKNIFVTSVFMILDETYYSLNKE